MYQRILVPFDGSATSGRGLDEAIGIATLTGASLRLIHMLDAGKARAEKAGVRVDTVLLEGMKTRLCDAVTEQASGVPTSAQATVDSIKDTVAA